MRSDDGDDISAAVIGTPFSSHGSIRVRRSRAPERSGQKVAARHCRRRPDPRYGRIRRSMADISRHRVRESPRFCDFTRSRSDPHASLNCSINHDAEVRPFQSVPVAQRNPSYRVASDANRLHAIDSGVYAEEMARTARMFLTSNTRTIRPWPGTLLRTRRIRRTREKPAAASYGNPASGLMADGGPMEARWRPMEARLT